MALEKLLEKYSELKTWQKVGIAAIGAPVGVAAGIAAAPMVGATLSAAGVGVLGGLLTGAASSSAGLAALGGGAVVTGGFGVAGGTAVVATTTSVATTVVTAAASYIANDRGSRSKAENLKRRGKYVNQEDIEFT